MNCKLLGYRKVDFNTPEGRHIDGINLYVCCSNPEVTGLECFKQFIPSSSNINVDLEIGASYDFQYSRYGGLSTITKA